MVIHLELFETLSGCFRVFPINYVTSKTWPLRVRFQDRKRIFGPKVHFLSAAACRFPFPDWRSRKPIKTEANMNFISTFNAFVGGFLGIEIDMFWMWPPPPALAQGLIDISEGGEGDQNRYRPKTDWGRRSDQNSAEKNVKQMRCQDALFQTNSKKSWSSVSLVKSSLTIINVPGESLSEEESHKRKLPALQMGDQSH